MSAVRPGIRADAEPAIRVRDVEKDFKLYRRRETTLKEAIVRRRRAEFDRFPALAGITFDVQPGEVLGVVGRNGSGKSTLLKLLGRIMQPDRGTIETTGRIAALLEVGAGFHPEYSAVENIFLSGAIYGVPRRELESRVGEIIAFAELERFAENPVKTYSSGMYARLGFSIAVNVDPDILLIDEVLAVGDQSFQARCLDRMLEFRDAGKTIVLVTHDLGAVESFCDRAIWIDGGRLREDSLPHHVVRSYVEEVNAGDERRSSAALADGPMVAEHVPINPSVPIVLRSMAFHGDDGAEREVFHNGEPLEIVVGYRCTSPVHAPICELELERHDGVLVTKASNRTGRLEVGDVSAGDGSFSWRIDNLALTPGTYYVTPRLIDQTGAHVLDEHPRWFRLRVHAGAYAERHGVAVLPGRWRHEVAGAPAPEPSRA